MVYYNGGFEGWSVSRVVRLTNILIIVVADHALGITWDLGVWGSYTLTGAGTVLSLQLIPRIIGFSRQGSRGLYRTYEHDLYQPAIASLINDILDSNCIHVFQS